MRAIVIQKFGGPENLVIKELPDPEPKPGHVVIQVKAFGINHAEMHMRRGEWAEAAEVSGIECVGLVKSCPGGEFAVGTKAAALMGGLGRTINGSYAEYTRAPATNVAPIESDLSWEELAAIPESYATAWTCLFRNLEVAPGQTTDRQAGKENRWEMPKHKVSSTTTLSRLGVLNSACGLAVFRNPCDRTSTPPTPASPPQT